MKKINCILADDELLAREILESHIAKIEQLNLLASCTNGAEVFNTLQKAPADLIFLDVKMPHISGIDLLKTFPNLPPVILTTAYSDYALESYQFNVIDYLVKPISFERFLKAIQKFNKTVNVPAQRPESTERPQEQAFMYVRADKKMVKIIYDDILYIEGLKDYVQLFMKDRKVLTHYTLNSFEEKLPELTFMRVHRSYIVSLPQITAFTARSVEVGEKEIPIGDVYQAKVAGRLG